MMKSNLVIPGDDDARLAEEYQKLLASLLESRRLDAPAFVQKSTHELLPDVKRALNQLADIHCRICRGSGVRKWRLGGRSADTCKCIR